MSLDDAFGEVMGGSGEIIIDHDGKIIETMLSGKCEKCGEHAVDCECEAVFDYVGDIVVTHRPIEDTCSIRVVNEDKIRFLYVGGSQYMGTNVFFDEVFLLEDAEAIRDALTICINKIKFKGIND